MTPWEKFFDDKIKLVALEKNILDIGGGFKQQKDLDKYKDLFKNSHYQVLDIDGTYQPDIVGDIQNLSAIKDASYDAVICKAVLEHVANPILAVAEIYRILKKGGKCLVYTPFLYSYHACPDRYKDYYRFTLDGIKWLFGKFSQIDYVPVRGRFETMIYLLPLKILRKVLSPGARIIDVFFKTEKQSSGYFIFLVK